MKIAVNGRFMTRRVTGVQRVARRMVDGLADLAELTLYVPRGARVPEPLSGRVRVVEGVLRGRVWEQLELPLRTAADRAELCLDPANAGPAAGGRRVLVLHDVFPLTHPEWYTVAFRRWFRLTVFRAAKRATRIVMFSEWAKTEAVRVLGVQVDRIHVIGQGLAPFDRPPDPATVQATLAGLGLQPGYILASGAGDLRKNGAFIEAVWRRLARNGNRPRLVRVGAPHAHIHAREPASRSRDIVRPGHITDAQLRALYAGAGVFCYPSLAEGFGRPPLEAMGCGTPVIAAPYGCAREVLGDGAAIVPLDVDAWVGAVDRLLNDSPARWRQVEAGRAHAARFDWGEAARQLVDVCAGVAAGSARRPALAATAPGG